ncbi:MinD/ParA family protein [Thiospirillum jenense]|uniref:MinD/ParA family protein n=1 Tax=Thiospirillum jenense TaxID=1653858 RepID=A0A839H9J1_9GAMM|nr:MinD/ParA family protein [Thiospirillum jenense]MBB1125671.1 MinD/ParA family protein [Thiospirillum jenense]
MRILCITSGKGGVGKTTMAINLGIAIANAGRRVLLMDGDLGLANLNVLLGIVPKLTIHDVVHGRKTLPQIIISTPYGVDLIAGGSGMAELADLTAMERQRVMRGLELLDGYDFLMIDTGAGIGENIVRFILASDETVIVTTPHPTSLTDAYGVIKTILSQQPSTQLKLLVNCVNTPADAQRVAASLSRVTDTFMHSTLECIGYVPVDMRIEKSILMQKPHLILNPNAPSAKLIHEIAHRLLTSAPLTQDKHANKIEFFLKKLVGCST